MDSVLAFDPGVQNVAMCLLKAGKVARLELIEASEGQQRMFAMVDAVRRALPNQRPGKVVIEWPEIYTSTSAWKGNPNNIRDLAAVAFGVACEVEYKYDLYSVLALPRTWKGNLPKEVHHARILTGLSPAQRKAVNVALTKVAPSLRHNLWDALGLALWGLGA